MTPQQPRIEIAGIDSLILRLFEQIDEANLPWLLAAASRLRAAFGPALIDLVPSYTTLLLHYDLQQLDDQRARRLIATALQDLQPADAGSGNRHELPVWYHPSVGPELALLASRSGLGTEGVIALHSSRDYRVFTLGFTPGFAFMGLVDQQIASPRLASPRPRIPPGSVAIAERQTAVYPGASPGGWNLIGRCPIRLFDPHGQPLSLLQPGDRVRFVPVSHAQFLQLGGDDSPLEACA